MTGSRTKTGVLATGRPIAVSPLLTRCTTDQIVVSVGPYTFQTSRPAALLRSQVNFRLSASPPHRATFRLDGKSPDSSNSRHNTGVACKTVVPLSTSLFLSRAPSLTSSELATHNCAPP